jgi:hypothetical protein
MSAVDSAVCADSSGAAGWHRFRVTVLVVAVALNLAAQAVDRLCPGTAGQRAVDRYQPASRAWQRALTQSALYLAVAALFLGLAWWRTLRPDQ